MNHIVKEIRLGIILIALLYICFLKCHDCCQFVNHGPFLVTKVFCDLKTTHFTQIGRALRVWVRSVEARRESPSCLGNKLGLKATVRGRDGARDRWPSFYSDYDGRPALTWCGARLERESERTQKSANIPS